MPSRFRKPIPALWKVVIILFLAALNILFLPSGKAAEAWKGNAPKYANLFSANLGANLFGTTVALAPVFSYGFLVNEQGWLDDIDESIYLEGQVGPLIFERPDGETRKKVGWFYSLHLRWEFFYDNAFSLYALGGVAGMFGPEYLGSVFVIHPRLGLGLVYSFDGGPLAFKGELSQDLLTAGLQIAF
jgi:hypothetical protein